MAQRSFLIELQLDTLKQCYGENGAAKTVRMRGRTHTHTHTRSADRNHVLVDPADPRL